MVHADRFSVTGLVVLSLQGPAIIIVTIRDPSLWYLGDSCEYIERGSVDVCLQNGGGYVRRFINRVNNEEGEMLTIKEGYPRTFQRDEHAITFSSLDRSSLYLALHFQPRSLCLMHRFPRSGQ